MRSIYFLQFSMMAIKLSTSKMLGHDHILMCYFVWQELSVLSPVVPWEVDDIWRIYAGYFFILHIPLSFGGLGVVAKVLQRSSLDSMTTVGGDLFVN